MILDVGITYYASLRPAKRNQGGVGVEARFECFVPVVVRELEASDMRPALRYEVRGRDVTIRSLDGRLYEALGRPAGYADDRTWLAATAVKPIPGEEDPHRRQNYRYDSVPERDLTGFKVDSLKDVTVERQKERGIGTVLVDGNLWTQVKEPYLHATHVERDGHVAVEVRVVENDGNTPPGFRFGIGALDEVRPFYEAAFPGRALRFDVPRVELERDAPLRLRIEEEMLVDAAIGRSVALEGRNFTGQTLEYMTTYCHVRDGWHLLKTRMREGQDTVEACRCLRDALLKSDAYIRSDRVDMAILKYDVAQARKWAREASTGGSSPEEEEEALAAMAP